LWDEPQRSWFSVPNIPQIVRALSTAYEQPRGKSDRAIQFAKGYGAEHVWQEYWLPALAQILK
jgi:hypothetical protein